MKSIGLYGPFVFSCWIIEWRQCHSLRQVLLVGRVDVRPPKQDIDIPALEAMARRQRDSRCPQGNTGASSLFIDATIGFILTSS